MTAPLLVIVPTRGRPHNAARLAKAFEETGSLNADLLFVADHDDPELPAYRAAVDRLLVHRGEAGRGMVAALNWAASLHADTYDHLGFMGDDHRPRTAGWDAHVLGALDTLEPRVVYGGDEALPTAVFLPSRLVRSLGFMAPPVLWHLYADDFWRELGRAVGGLRFLPEVVIEHVHPAAVNDPGADAADRQAWQRFRDGDGMAAALDRVRDEYLAGRR